MPSTYSNLKIQLMATGENNTTWGTITNTNLGTAIEEAITGSADVTFASANVTLTLTDSNASQTARNLRLRCTGTTGGARDLIVPAIEKAYIVRNDCADTITVKNATGSGVAVPASQSLWVFNDGTNVVNVVTYLSSVTLGSALPVASGGTGGNTASTGRTGLGATIVGANLFTLTDPSAITFPRFNADNTVSALTDVNFRTAIGAGTVTSVGGTGTVNGLTLTGTVTGSGNLTLGGTLSVDLSTGTVTGTLPVGRGGTGAPTLTGVVIGTGTTAFTTKTNPSGAFVGDTDTQNLTNKTLTTGNTLNAGTTVSDTGTIAATSPGFRGVPQNTRTGAYTLLLTDAGKHVYSNSAVTINASIFSAGDSFVIVNSNTATTSINITAGAGVTLRLAGTTTAGTPRPVAPNGMASVLCVVGGASPVFLVSGAGVS